VRGRNGSNSTSEATQLFVQASLRFHLAINRAGGKLIEDIDLQVELRLKKWNNVKQHVHFSEFNCYSLKTLCIFGKQ